MTTLLIRLRRIYNFCCSMLDYISVRHVFIIFLYYFGIIYVINLLTRCTVQVLVFCCLFISEKLLGKVSRNQMQIYRIYIYEETKMEPRGHLKGGPTGPDAPQVRPTPWPHVGPTWPAPSLTRAGLSSINHLRPEKAKYLIIFSRKYPRPPPSPLPGTLSEGEIITGGIYATMPASGVMRE